MRILIPTLVYALFLQLFEFDTLRCILSEAGLVLESTVLPGKALVFGCSMHRRSSSVLRAAVLERCCRTTAPGRWQRSDKLIGQQPTAAGTGLRTSS
jgi:hypothetical protein